MIRPARAEDCPMLSELALRSKAAWGYSAEFIAGCRDELTVEVEHVGNTFVLEQDGRAIAFYTMSLVDAAHVELEFLFVEPSMMHRGHGRTLLDHARRHARDSMGRGVMVIQGDPNADRFYRAAGARRIGERASSSIPGRMLPLYELDC